MWKTVGKLQYMLTFASLNQSVARCNLSYIVGSNFAVWLHGVYLNEAKIITSFYTLPLQYVRLFSSA